MREGGEEKCILLNISGHGFFDMTAYNQYLAGKLEDFEYSAEAVGRALAELPQVG